MIHMRCVEETNYKHITSTWTFLSTDAHKTIAVPCSCTGRNNKKFIKNQILAHKLVLDARLGGVRKISALPSVVYGICMPSSFLWLLTLWNWRELMIIDHQHLWLLVRFECSPTRCTPTQGLFVLEWIEGDWRGLIHSKTNKPSVGSQYCNWKVVVLDGSAPHRSPTTTLTWRESRDRSRGCFRSQNWRRTGSSQLLAAAATKGRCSGSDLNWTKPSLASHQKLHPHACSCSRAEQFWSEAGPRATCHLFRRSRMQCSFALGSLMNWWLGGGNGSGTW